MRTTSVLALVSALAGASWSPAQTLAVVDGVEFQPFAAATSRLIEALDSVGAPIGDADQEEIERLLSSDDRRRSVSEVQRVLDGYCVAGVNINPESRVKVAEGPVAKHLVEQGWRTFLVKVHNEAGITPVLHARSPNAKPLHKRSTSAHEPRVTVPPDEVPHRFLDLALFQKRPLKPQLSGLTVEYVVLQIYTRDAGKREAQLTFDVGQGTQDIGFRNAVSILFDCKPAVKVELEVLDVDGEGTMASFIVKDRWGRIYPAQARRLAPDFFFHPQVYREDGEHLLLPPGTYDVTWNRGPEYLVSRRQIVVPNAERHRESFQLERWIHVAADGWRSGDHHVHAAGCAHYESPTEGVTPADMMRHVLGEDLNVGCVLSWGPCWYHQKQFFDGKVHPLSTPDYVMRYDVEVSGFPSSHTGHLTLLRLDEDDYPGTTRINEWPSWDLPILKWAKEQGGITGFAHSGWGLQTRRPVLPSYDVPPFDGIGANEYVVDVVHGVVDFISTVDTPAPWELNIWYHTLNCGFTTRISGETDFPCIYGEKVGLGRVYVKMPEGPIDFDVWVEGLRDGRSYVCDGMSHLLDFEVGGVAVGEMGSNRVISRLDLAAAGSVKVAARVAARLEPQKVAWIHERELVEKPYWHLERARVGATRQVPVELVVNGEAVARQVIEADGRVVPIEFETRIDQSSWVALRIYPSSHTNPVFVHVADRPIRASKRSAQWCLDGVERCWKSKVGNIREEEREAARKAYDVAAAAYRKILDESDR